MSRPPSDYMREMRATRKLLKSLGHPDPLSYEPHAPMPLDKIGMLAAWTRPST
ncbi:hypothetical protein ACIQ9R_31080 [Streptomyces sp. NPDC094447]|uniref:hypothetical protein n=1 Tax=Streptomyces sp. NPDC094447 TaxID=3366062 RepID=UPI0038157D95